jgi:hypothetical protein
MEYKEILNPVKHLLEALNLSYEKAKEFPIPNSEDVISIIPEFLSETTARYFYGQDKVLALSCFVEQAKTKKLAYFQFIDEVDFYDFMRNYHLNTDNYFQPQTEKQKKLFKILADNFSLLKSLNEDL